MRRTSSSGSRAALAAATAVSALVAAAAACALAGAAEAQPLVRIENAAARVRVSPEARRDVAVEIQPGRARLPGFTTRREGQNLILDQGLSPRFGLIPVSIGLNCRGGGEGQRVSVPGHGEVAVADLPLVILHTPQDVRVAVGTAVFGEVGAARSLELSNAGCGDWRLADVAGPVRISTAGSGDVRGARAGDLRISVSGSSDVSMATAAGLSVSVSGSGDVRLGDLQGPLEAHIAGSGDVVVDHGRAPRVKASVAGSGDVRFGGDAGALDAAVAGSGDVVVRHVQGPVSKHVAGSGEVRVDG